MPPEIMRIESGSALTASGMTTSVVFLALPGTSDTTSKSFEAEKAVSQKVFLHSHSFQPLLGLITERDTMVGKPHARQIITVLTALQEGLQQWQIVFQPLQEQLVSVLQPLQEQIAFLGARLAAVVWNPLTELQALQEHLTSSLKEGTGTAGLSPTVTETISPNAAQRLKGHEKIVQEVCSLAKEEAQARRLSILKIDVRPAWSHEYDERTGIVIDVEIRASSDERFSYWDAVCERLSQMEDLLPPEEQRFLQDQAFFVVNEG